MVFTKSGINWKKKYKKVKLDKSFFLRLSILNISKAMIHKIWYDYIKPKHKKKNILADTDSLIKI